ncbi:hypothetical protein PRK78_000923 [Emydomyces testavorans]|uniref:J domain-containing protein n=1 Tax=Emydomyces testavorans TaxID=2070801 RepID=A0AAF0DDF2_9EURO|nr:hypothetical protein PRK78_000923 [Emydomyces testavorans]
MLQPLCHIFPSSSRSAKPSAFFFGDELARRQSRPNQKSRQFYALSLAHHPDRNPKDSSASARFASISNAYHVLSHAAKRAKYDRDHDIHRAATTTSPTTRRGHRGSYVGSRPPSGLSKRRGPFRGPPPSFYAHGEYGTAYHNQPRHPSQHQHQHHAQQPSSASTSSSSPHPDPSHFIYHNTVPHFNATSHFRTQTHEDVRRRERRLKAVERAKREAAARGVDVSDDEGNITMRLLLVLGILGVACAVAMLGREVLEGPRSTTAAAASSSKKMHVHVSDSGLTKPVGQHQSEGKGEGA